MKYHIKIKKKSIIQLRLKCKINEFDRVIDLTKKVIERELKK